MPLGLARDMPDDFHILPNSRSSPVQNLGELVARLGKPPTMDGRGEVLWFDTCDKGLSPFSLSSAGTGGEYFISDENAGYGNYSLALTAGSDAGHYCVLQHQLPVPFSPSIGVEFQYRITTLTSACYAYYVTYIGSIRYFISLKIDYDSQELQVVIHDGSYVPIHTFSTDRVLGIGVAQCKLVANIETGYYSRVLFEEIELDISDYSLYALASSSDPALFIQFQNLGRLSYNDIVYIQHMIVTSNEP